MKSFLRLIRWQNLLIIALTLILSEYCIIHPILYNYQLEPTFTNLDCFFMILAWLLIAAGGYIINDYFDTQVDRINRPETQIVGNTISRGNATTLHLTLTIIGCLLGFLVSVRTTSWKLGLTYPFVAGLLWFYSSAYKKQFLVGNLVVAFITGLGITMPAIYEYIGQSNVIMAQIVPNSEFEPNILINTMLEFAIFAFITTMAREIIKDMEDVEGDKANDCNSVPIVLGEKTSKIIVISLIAITIGGLIYAYFNYLDERELDFENYIFINRYKSMLYIGLLLILPLIYLAYKVLDIKSKKDCHFCSQLMKVIMLLAILYMLIMRYDYMC